MELDLPLFQKLVNMFILEEHQAKTIIQDKDVAVLDRDTAFQLENGIIVARYLEHVIGLMEQKKMRTNNADVSKLNQLKEANTPATKLFNWNIVLKELEKLGISIDSDSRGLIIAGDVDMILDTLK